MFTTIPPMRPPIISFGDSPDVVAVPNTERVTKSFTASNAVTDVRMLCILYHVADHSSTFAVNVPPVMRYAVELNTTR